MSMVKIQRLAFAEQIHWKASKEMFIKELNEILQGAFETAGQIFDYTVDMEDVMDLMIVPTAGIPLSDGYKSSTVSFWIANANAKEKS